MNLTMTWIRKLSFYFLVRHFDWNDGVKMRVVSLFSGAGGMDVGFTKSDDTVVWTNELDAGAASTYQKDNPDAILCQGDIKVQILCANGQIEL